MFIRTGWSLRSFALVVLALGVAAGIAFLLRDTTPGCSDGYVRVSATRCEESDGRFAARILGSLAGLNACLVAYYFIRNWRRRQRLLQLANDDPDAFTRVVAEANGIELRLPEYEPDRAIKGHPGWFYDPMLESRLRYWDGDAWTRWISTPSGASILGREVGEHVLPSQHATDVEPAAERGGEPNSRIGPVSTSAEGIVEDLNALDELHKRGEISDASYNVSRKALLALLDVKQDE